MSFVSRLYLLLPSIEFANFNVVHSSRQFSISLLYWSCCGKKQYNIKFKDVYVLIQDKKTGKNNWMMGEIGDKIETTNIELEKLNTIGECKISIPSINSKKN